MQLSILRLEAQKGAAIKGGGGGGGGGGLHKALFWTPT